MNGVRITPTTSGSMPVWSQIHDVMNAASTIVVAWARLSTFMTPNVSVNPDDMSA